MSAPFSDIKSCRGMPYNGSLRNRKWSGKWFPPKILAMSMSRSVLVTINMNLKK